MRHLLAATSLFALAAFAAPAGAAAPKLTPAQHDATHAMFEHIINIPTVIGRHHVPEEAQYVADQFKAAGFPAADVHVMPYHTGSATTGDDETAALIVRWRAAGKPSAEPILLMGHMDVVEAKPEDWSATDPFKMVEKDGYYYGRGTIDMKDGIVAITQAMINLQGGRVQAEARHRRAVHGRRGDQRHRREQRRERMARSARPSRSSGSTPTAAVAVSTPMDRPPDSPCRPPKRPSPATR